MSYMTLDQLRSIKDNAAKSSDKTAQKKYRKNKIISVIKENESCTTGSAQKTK